MSVLSKIKDWLTGKSTSTSKLKQANKTSYYGGGVSTKSTQTTVKKSVTAAKKKKKEEKPQQQAQTTAFKSYDTKTQKIAEAREKREEVKEEKPDVFNRKNAFKATGLPQTRQQKLQSQMQSNIDKKLNAPQSTAKSTVKATPPTIKHQSTALGTLSERDTKSRLAKMNVEKIQQRERNRAAEKLKPLIDEKYSGKTKESKRRIKSGDYAADPDVAKYETLKHPVRESFARGALSGTTFGLSDLAMAKLPMSEERREAERLYQANKNKTAEAVGELAGSLASFGATSAATEKLAAKLAPNAAERLAEKQFIKKGAEKLVNRAAEKGIIGDATQELIKQVGKDKAAKIATAVGGDIVQNATTGLIYDFNKASAEHEIGSKDWWKEMGKSAAFNAVITGGIAGHSLYTGGRNLVQDAASTVAKRADARSVLRPVGNVEPQRQIPRIGESIEDRIARIDAERLGAKTDVPTVEPPKAETPKSRRQKLTAEEKYERMTSRADEKADAIRAELGQEYEEPVKGAKPAAETLAPKDAKKEYTVQLTRENGKKQKVKVEATSDAEALDKAIGKKKGVKKSTILDKAEAKPTAETPNVEAQTPKKNVNLDDVVNKKREKKTFREQFHELASSAKTKISDSLNAFEEANKQYIRTDHQKWLENVGAIDKTRRSGAIAARSIGEAQVKWNGDVFEGGKSLKSIYDGMDEATEKDFDKYLLMRHAPDRIREGKPIFAGTQFDSVEACEREAKALLDKHPEFAERAEELYQYTRNELQNRVDAGLLKQETADEWAKKYPNYVPTGRDGDFGDELDIWDIRGQLQNKGNTIGAGEIKKAKGGDQPIRSIKEQLADATNRNWRDMSMNNLFRKMFGDKVGDELATYADGGIEKVLDNTINLSKSKDGGKYFAEVFVDGDMKRIEVEKRFYDAIEDLYKNGRFGNGLDVLTDAASKVANPFKNLVTSWNPIFMVKNGMRDFPEAIINSRQTKEFLECMPSAMKELTSEGEFYQAFRNSGVSQSNFVNLEEALTSGDNWLKKGVNKFATAQEMVETYPRLIEYMATIKKAGYNLEDGIKNVPMEIRDMAAANAADVTVNFGRSGSVGKMLNRGLVPFFNPSVQGWSKFLRNLSEQGSTKAFLGFGVKALALGAGVQTVNNLLLEDNPNYQQISARDKATNIIIPITWGKDVTSDNTNLFVKIPKSRFAATLSLPMVNAGNENKMGWAEMLRVAKDQVFVVDPTESNLLSPLLLARQNKTWYGSPIVPKALEDLPKSEQYDANTSWFGKTLGKATANLPEELQISPKKADYIIDAETGVIGDFLLPATTPSRQGGGNALQKAGHSSLNVLKRSFTIDSVTQNDLSTRFYDKMQKANTASQSSKGTKEDKEEYKRYSGYSKEISKINKAITALQNGNRKTKQDDIYGLQKVRNQMMQDAIDGKDVPSEYKAMDAVQKYVGTAYAVNHFGTTADKRAMKMYTAKKYGTLSATEQRKAINADKDFYKGVQSIGKLQAKMEKAGITSDTTLSKAIALASVDASDDLFGAYKAQDQSRTETAHEMKRARTYFKNGGSTDEFVKLEKCRKTVGKLPEDQRKDELKKLDDEFAKGKMSYAEYDKREAEINYNADISYIGLSTSLAQANSPERGYRVYDIKDKNIQKGINLAAMGYTARDYRKMSKELDADGNGYPKKQEIIDYLNKGNFKDKATLYDVLYYYKGKYNPFGTPTKYTRAQAAAEGKKKGVEWITDETDDIKTTEEASGGGYYRRWGRWHRWGRHGGGRKAKAVGTGSFKARVSHPSQGGSSAKVPKTSVSVKSTSRAGSDANSVNAGTSTKATMPKASATPKVSIPTTRRSGVSGGGSSSGLATTSVPPTVKARTTGSTPTSTRARRATSTGSAINSAKSHRATTTSTKARGTTSTARVSSNIKRSQARMRSGSKMDITPLNIKPVKASKSTKGYNSNLSAALKDIENTQKKVAPPKARRK